MRKVIAVVSITLVISTTAFAAPTPSRGGADLQTIQTAVEQRDVAAGLAAAGFTPERVREAIDRLSPADIHQIATNVKQLQTAGGLQARTWMAIGMVAIFVVALVALGDDDEKNATSR